MTLNQRLLMAVTTAFCVTAYTLVLTVVAR
jgi:hypothetical protein